MERNKPASVPLEEWALAKFGEQRPALLEVPDYLGDDNDAPSLRAYFDEWGPTIKANQIAVAAYAASRKARPKPVR